MAYLPTVDDADVTRNGAVNVSDLQQCAAYANRWSSHSTLLQQCSSDRGNAGQPHEIDLHNPPAGWPWGITAVENPMLGAGDMPKSMNFWMVAEPDVSITGPYTSRLAIYSCHMRWLVGSTWYSWDGYPSLSWKVSSNYATDGDYVDVTHTLEADGSWSFALPTGKALHMSQFSPGVQLTTAPTAIIAAMWARLINGQEKWAVNCGTDYKRPDGTSDPIAAASGNGRFLRLGATYRRVVMLSSSLTDAELTANPPPAIPTPAHYG